MKRSMVTFVPIMHRILIIVLFGLTCTVSAQKVDEKVLDRIGFGSCALHFGKQKIWNSVIKNNPQLWVWLGDNIYSETLDVNKRAGDYQQLAHNVNYQKLRAQCPEIATWDDHDYGYNDCGKEFPMKEESKRLFLEFFNEPRDSPRWKRQGIYDSYTYGSGDRKVKFIMLDLRYNRDEPGPNSDMMGDEQWAWLEQELRNNTATLTIIGSSVQFVSPIKGFENWDKFPASQQRMLNLIRDMGSRGVIFISGDVHYGQLSKRKYEQVDYPIYDLTSSGLTHGNQIVGFKHPYRVDNSRYGYRNFGMILIDWPKRAFTFEVRNVRNKVVYSWTIPFSEVGQ